MAYLINVTFQAKWKRDVTQKGGVVLAQNSI
jgi:hypothetical protein